MKLKLENENFKKVDLLLDNRFLVVTSVKVKNCLSNVYLIDQRKHC